MAFSHRHGDSRICGASTVVQLQDFVEVEDQLWAVDGDPNSHGDGALITSHDWITIDGKGIIVNGDHAGADDLCPLPPHCDPAATGFSDLVEVD